MHPYRTHHCGELKKADVNERVRLSGWVHSVRDHGGVIFIDLRDHYGITQIVIDPRQPFYRDIEHWRVESVLCFTGTVTARSPETVNPRLATGEIEVSADEMRVLAEAEPIPFQIAREDDCSEFMRLEHRYLDLRRHSLHRNIVLRSQIITEMRKVLTERGFCEYQTPILTSSSPEGARDYLVPSRLHPGSFYALPQAPQQFKQLLMVGGFDKYFQVAPCFRDEDARADRSPGEFYQLDMEMSFVTQDELFEAVEDVMVQVFRKYGCRKMTEVPFPRLPYREAMDKYGTDKPDLRNPLEMRDVTEIFRDSGFNAFANTVAQGGTVRTIAVKGCAGRPRKFFDDMIGYAQSVGAKGLAYIAWVDGREKSPIAKFLSREELDRLKAAGEVDDGDVMFFVADAEKDALRIGGRVRDELGRRLELIDETIYRFCWVVDFPMYELNEDTGEVEFSHNPFSMPQGGMKDLEEKDPLDVLAYQYDIVCNGVELSSGAVRNHDPELMYRAFEIAGYDRGEVDRRFPALQRAFHYGAPPHAGIAPGIDRIVMLCAGAKNIREVIAFPMNQRAQDLMMSAPNAVSEQQLRELHIRIRRPSAGSHNAQS
ncbi:aspartate--tRNA ligase [Kiritimatiella glycovorans]|uniref:Aspartate--tRNA(Asp/Asn) ligase n=1 Tax=Kiritimatiella glycovorans TaxID=1307763 RepID=A0A0G3EJD0_9BACT|nr:aspartate--tRNA ligase [Kiritimatiella glycovorans]AKJ64284.1 Aspartate--tRNA ligase [Kiritimatiella glycovorans]